MSSATLPDNCDGFNVTHFCSPRSPDCLHGSCWHMDRVRQMVRRWFSRVGPAPRLGWEPKQPTPQAERERKLTKAEREEREQIGRIIGLVIERRAAAWRADFERRWRGVPARLWVYRDTGGGSSSGGDVDGTGSWGRIVRLWEDRDDER